MLQKCASCVWQQKKKPSHTILIKNRPGLSDWHHSRALRQWQCLLSAEYSTDMKKPAGALCNSLSLSLLHPSLACSLWMRVRENNVIIVIYYYLRQTAFKRRGWLEECRSVKTAFVNARTHIFWAAAVQSRHALHNTAYVAQKEDH